MSTWSRPYLRLTPTGGSAAPWAVPDGGLPPGPLDLVALGLPAAGTVAVRWRHPGSPHARHATFALTDPAWADLVRDLTAARAEVPSTRVATWTGSPSSAITAMASNRLLGHHLPQQLTGPPMHRQLRLQLGDSALGRGQLGLLRRRQPRHQPAVDAVLPAPGVDRLGADAEVANDIGH